MCICPGVLPRICQCQAVAWTSLAGLLPVKKEPQKASFDGQTLPDVRVCFGVVGEPRAQQTCSRTASGKSLKPSCRHRAMEVRRACPCAYCGLSRHFMVPRACSARVWTTTLKPLMKCSHAPSAAASLILVQVALVGESQFSGGRATRTRLEADFQPESSWF